MKRATFFMRSGGVLITAVEDNHTPASMGQRFGGGFISGRDNFWGSERELVINLVDVRAVMLEQMPPQHGVDHKQLHKELGDVLWCVAALCTKLGFDMGDIMAANIDKLKERYPDGYKSEDSERRADVFDPASIFESPSLQPVSYRSAAAK